MGGLAFAQSDLTVHVNQFPGSTVAQKISAAMATCPASGPCFLVVDASLHGFASRMLPALCKSCTLLDYRDGDAHPATVRIRW